MTTKRRALTGCDGPSCDSTHEEGEGMIPDGWLCLRGDLADDLDLRFGLDFCCLRCLSGWAAAALKRYPSQSKRDGAGIFKDDEPTSGDPRSSLPSLSAQWLRLPASQRENVLAEIDALVRQSAAPELAVAIRIARALLVKVGG